MIAASETAPSGTASHRVRIIGLAVSLVGGAALSLLSDDVALGIIGGLVGSAITLQLETLQAVARRGEQDRRVVDVVAVAAAEPAVRQLLSALPRAVDAMGLDPFFQEVSRRRIREFAGFIRHLGNKQLEGRVSTGELVTFLNSAQKTVRATSMSRHERDFWATEGAAYWQANVEALRRGVQIERIFICEQPNDPITEEEIRRQVDEEVTVYRVEESRLGRRHWRLILIRDDAVVQHIRMGEGKDAQDYTYYLDEDAVTEAREAFNAIRAQATVVPKPAPRQPHDHPA